MELIVAFRNFSNVPKVLIPLAKFLVENLTVAQLFKDFSTLKETRWYLIVFTRGDHRALSDIQKRKTSFTGNSYLR